MALEEGVVCRLHRDGWAEVITERKDACSRCSAAHSCRLAGSGATMITKALNRAGAGVHDRVAISLKRHSLLKTAGIVYMIPVICFLLGAIAGVGLTKRLDMGIDTGAVLFGLAGLGLGFLIVILISRSVSHPESLTPIIVRIIQKGNGGSGSLRSMNQV
ncbi:MAG: SoxR reducing system RseC family protein [Deltaproteobacteria bacterium]|nr:SoxR reducing system RseC family protein [Deltaproteobacteria bacterium]